MTCDLVADMMAITLMAIMSLLAWLVGYGKSEVSFLASRLRDYKETNHTR
jgi:hypothetical protein